MTANLNVARANDALSSPAQLSLPVGLIGLVRPRRERTDEDRAWYSKQLAVQHVKRIDKLVFERLAFYGSLNPDRTAYPSVKRLASEAMCSERSARYALRRLESVGLIECLYGKGGRVTSRYRVVGSTDCNPGLQTVPPSAANPAPEVLREGKRVSKTRSSLSAVPKSVDRDEPEKEQEVLPAVFPSQSKKSKEKAPLPIADEPVFENPAQVNKLFKLQRKLGYEANDQQAVVFDRLEHPDKKRILDRLEAEEQIAAANDEVLPPPKKPREPRAEVAVERKPKPERPPCVEHRWTPAAADGIRNCHDCDAETGPE